jgi:hypothetical protein
MDKYYAEVSVKGGTVGVEFESDHDLDDELVLKLARMEIQYQLYSAELDFWSKSVE